MTLDGIIFMESSGIVREAFRARGLNVYSCDLQPADDGSPHHFQGDARAVVREHAARFYGFHPTCTYLCGSGIHWNDRGRGWEKTDAALGFVLWCMSHELPWYLENPVGLINTMIRKPDQIIQPYNFGADASKATCLWLNKLPPLVETGFVEPRYVCCGESFDYGRGKRGCAFCCGENVAKPRWSNQTDSGQNRLGPSADRWKLRSKTYPGIAAAMAAQWGTPAELKLTA